MKMRQNAVRAMEVLRSNGDDFAVIDNPPGVYPSQEVVPLAPVYKKITGLPSAIFLDMDGTITCTEPLFLHGVETVVRRATGWTTQQDWAGLDAERDHPRIVGFSTQRNLEYLYTMVGEAVVPEKFIAALDDALRFLAEHPLPDDLVARVRALLAAYGLTTWWEQANRNTANSDERNAFRTALHDSFPIIDSAIFSQFGLLIFYADYLDALEKVNRGEGADVSNALFGDPAIPAVGPMPGVALLGTLMKGWLPEASANDVVATCDGYPVKGNLLKGLCRRFSGSSVPVALVTSSGAHETKLVLEAVFRAIRSEIETWSLPTDVYDRISAGFESPESFFDAIVTCDDVIEGRTKPFRDPYTVAMDRLDLHGLARQRIIGFEDTEAGIIAQRGAGVGVPCALPIEFTAHQDFSAAAHVLPGGVLDAVLKHGLFLEQ